MPTSKPSRPVRILHLITGTGVGGAEAMLHKLLSAMHPQDFENLVISMIEPGGSAERIRSLGFEVRTLGMKRRHADPRAMILLAKEVRGWAPHLIQTWMYHADLLGGLVGKLVAHVPVIWNIRHSEVNSGANSWMTDRVAGMCGLLSTWIPARIVCCAESSRKVHTGIGYCERKIIVIPNGFDTAAFQPCPDAPAICHQRFGIPAESEVISLIARYHPQKDHANFVAAARQCAAQRPHTLFALAGDGITDANQELNNLIRTAGIEDRVLLLGRRTPGDIVMLMSRSTAVTSTSSAEAFPNVVGEAMACARVCVVTDVGDSADIVGDTGIVVPPRSPDRLLSGWMQVLNMDRATRDALGQAARRRVETRFSLAAIASRYQNLYADLVGVERPAHECHN